MWQQVVGMMGLISFIDGDECIVTTSTEFFDASEAPVFIWGKNILELSEEAHAATFDKGVFITSFDPITGTSLEAFYPPLGDKRARMKHVRASKKHGPPPPALDLSKYEPFAYPGVTDPQALEALARRTWEERARQELSGRLRTVEMWIGEQESAPKFDLLDLRAGDCIRVVIDPIDAEQLKALGELGVQQRYLEERGYPRAVAGLIVVNVMDHEFEPVFHVKSLRATLETSGDSGSFDIEIDFHNRIDVRIQ